MALFMPSHWRFTSIDPLMQFDPSTLHAEYAHRIDVAACLSQEYSIQSSSCIYVSKESTNTSEVSNLIRREVSLVIACHSHAPLAEFWDRLPCTQPPHIPQTHSTLATATATATTSVTPTVLKIRLCVSMPCCGKLWSILPMESPVSEYEDYEVFSARRRVLLYADDAAKSMAGKAATTSIATTTCSSAAATTTSIATAATTTTTAATTATTTPTTAMSQS